MNAEMDPAKMKVIDLRQELANRGLDTKGNKPALVKRLKDALELELKRDLPDTSIADTSTEDFDSSQLDVSTKDDERKDSDDGASEEKMETEEGREADPAQDKATLEQNGDEQTSEDDKAQADKDGEKTESGEGDKADGAKDGEEKPSGQKGEKRRRSGDSPERAQQRRRSRSPVKEDEPEIDSEKVQLSWYDSDLHLQVDKENFLSAKPYFDGAFGYAWAGARTTYGITSGKVHYEVKLTEKLKWEDLGKKNFENRRHWYDSKKYHNKDDKRKKPDTKKPGDAENKPENGEVKAQEGGETQPAEATEKSTENVEKDPLADSQEAEAKPAEEEKPAEAEQPAEKEGGDVEMKSAEDAEKPEGEEKAAEGEEKKPEEGDEKSKEEDKEAKAKKEFIPIPSHAFRVGWSIVSTGLQLGEEKYSYGFDSTGNFVTENEFKEFGKVYDLNNVVGAYLDINDEFVKFSFTVNDGEPEEALVIPRSELPEEFALFPHITTRNYAYELNLGSKDPWFPVPESLSDYVFFDAVEDKVAGPNRPAARSDCEVILMIGLPASGKTHWVKKHVEENPDKRFTVIGNTHFLDRMTVNGSPLKKKFSGRWNFIIDKTQKCLNELQQIACLRRRNYIIDQTNVFPSAQRRKMRPFEGFKRTAVVVVVGDEEQAKRQTEQEAQGCKDMPDSAVLELKANMTLPDKGNWLDDILFAELAEEEAKEQVKKYNTEGREAGYGPGTQKRRDDRKKFYNLKRLNDRGSYRERFGRGGYERGGRGRGWYAGRSGGARGSWDRDRRDNRSYSRGGRDWGSSRGGHYSDRGSRDYRGGGGGYSSRGPRGGGGPGAARSGGWQSSRGGSWGGQGGGWSQQSWGGQGQGGWQSSGQGGQGGWAQGGQGQGGWKYGGGGGQGAQSYGGGYSAGGGGSGGNWNYYGQYSQNWANQSRKKP